MSWVKRSEQKLEIGDRVQYAAEFLKSIGAITGDLPFARGTITKLIPLGSTTLAEIDWQNPDIPERVNIANLERIHSPTPRL